MSNQLIPPIDLAPADLNELTPGQRVAVWLDLLRAGDKLVMAGLAREVGPTGDVQAAYADWCACQGAEHDRVLERMLRRMQPTWHADAC